MKQITRFPRSLQVEAQIKLSLESGQEDFGFAEKVPSIAPVRFMLHFLPFRAIWSAKANVFILPINIR